MSRTYSFGAPARGGPRSASGPDAFGARNVSLSSQTSCHRFSISSAMAARARIQVDSVDSDTFRVTVSEGSSRTVHTVTVDPAYHQRLTGGSVPAEELVRHSFGFLLEREPKESILGSFALPVISRYFAEYEREIARRIRSR